MAWIESHQTLREHAKTRKAAARLGIPRVHLVGHLQTLWWWAMDHAEDGDLSEFDAEDIALAAEWDGEPEKFMQALIECGPGGRPGFIEVDGIIGDPEQGKTAPLALRNWWTYAGKLIARRQHDRERKRVERRSPTVPPPSDGRPEDIPGTSTPPSLGRATRPDPTKPTEPRGEATAQTLIGEYVTACKSKPPQRHIGHLARETKALLEEGYTAAQVRPALDRVRVKGLNPTTLPSVLNELLNARVGNARDGPQPGTRTMIG